MISRTSTPASDERSSRPIRRSGNFLSRQQHEDVLEVRGPALALVAVGAEDRDARARPARAVACLVRLALALQQPRRRPVALDRLGTRVLGDQLARRAGRDRLAV